LSNLIYETVGFGMQWILGFKKYPPSLKSLISKILGGGVLVYLLDKRKK